MVSGQNLGLSADFYYGFFWPHRTTMRHIVDDYAKGFSISFELPYHNEIANQYYDAPYWGAMFLYLNPGNQQVLGNTYSLVPYMQLHLVNQPKFKIKTKLGLGSGWVEKTYDRVENFKNTAIGSHVNLVVHLNLNASLNVFANTYLNAGLNFTHLSNGATVLPNLGLNIPTLNVGIHSYFGKKSHQEFTKTEQEKTSTKSLIAHLQYGVREVEPNAKNVFPNYNLSLEYLAQKSEVSGFSGMLDLFYKTTLKERARIDTGITRNLSNFQVGLMGAYHKTINPIDIYLGMGAYLFDNAKFDGLFYHRLGMRYLATEKLLIGFSIYSHFAKADHFQFGVGYKIK